MTIGFSPCRPSPAAGKRVVQMEAIFADDARFRVIVTVPVWMDTVRARRTKLMLCRRLLKLIKRCILMTTDPGDLVLDPTCGSGTTAYVCRAMGAALDNYRHLPSSTRSGPRPHHGRPLLSYYLLSDSKEGQVKEAEESRAVRPRRCPPTATSVRDLSTIGCPTSP